MEDILEKILGQLTRIADYYDAKGKREINKDLKVLKEKRSTARRNSRKEINTVKKAKNDKSL